MTVLGQYQKTKLELEEKGSFGILLFRLGDFYEAFYEDALQLKNILTNIDTHPSSFSDRWGFPQYGIHYENKEILDYLVEAGYNVLIKDGEEIKAY